MDESTLEWCYKDWKRLGVRRATPEAFYTLYATRMTKGWSFLGQSSELHERDVNQHKADAAIWLATKQVKVAR